MKRVPALAGIVLIFAALAACSPGINTLGNNITFDSNGIVVHALGHPSAHVSRDGVLEIDGKAIDVTQDQRQLLQRYYQQARDTMSSGTEVGKQGVQIATRSVGAAISSIFHDGSSPAEKKLDAQSDRIEAAADKLCADLKALGATQKAIATAIPAFAPYASRDRLECGVTHGTTDALDGKPSGSAITYASLDPKTAAANHASSQPAPHPGHPDTPPPSQP
ncbi:MAG TPA: DUF2884 family protein [Rhodanobacteraceae bacterium]|nr:DUF2884 family protein [Rhodanobacteraceae bacterium]